MSQYEEQPQTDTNTQPVRASTAGGILAAHRQNAGMSVEEVAAQLKLAKRQVEALEEDRFDALPGNTFVRGFVRNYARLLQIDPQPLLNDLATRLPVEAPQAALPRLQDEAMPMRRPGSGIPVPSGLFIVLGMVLVLVVGGGWYYLNTHHEPLITVDSQPANTAVPVAAPVQSTPPQAAAPVSAVAEKAPEQPLMGQTGGTPTPTPLPITPPTQTTVVANATPVVTPAAPVNAAETSAPAPVATATQGTNSQTPPSDQTDGVRVVAKADTWVQVIDATGHRLVNEVVKSGDSRSVSGKPPYQVKIGNGPKTELYYKGQLTDLGPHLKADVATLELK